MIGAIVISHGDLSDAVLDALYQIAGSHQDILAVSNSGRDLKQMEIDLLDAIDRLKNCDEVIFFSDLHGGSCSLMCRRLIKENGKLAMVTGYNLPMLIEFAFNRSKPLIELLAILEKKGKTGIRVFCHSEEP